MSTPSPVKIWAAQTRASFLILSVLLVLLGAAAAHMDGHGHLLHTLLMVVGVVLAHISVNLFNEHSDNRTGIDHNTERTPFSGGSGSLQAGHTTPRAVLGAAIGSLAVAAAIGAYLSWVAGWLLLIPIALGGLASVLYTTYLARWALGELASGLCLGTLVVLGTYYVLAGNPSLAVILVSIPPGLLTAQLLFLNEFPDAEVDKAGGRRHLVIRLGKRRAAVLYAVVMAAVYLTIVVAAATRVLPMWSLLGLVTLPLAVKASLTALKHHSDRERLIPAMGANVMTVLGTDLALAVGLFLA
jgi:1,4-dihydroxy-2-naphthoate polyprenyltransferase